MQNPSDIQAEIDYAKALYSKGVLPGPIVCSCKSKSFKIYYDKQYKTNPMSFTCANPKCRKKFPIIINSFFSKFAKQKLKLTSEIMKIFLDFDYNATKAYKYITNELNINCNKALIRKIYKEMRDTISKYLLIDYESGYLCSPNDNKYYSVDESNIITISSTHIWLLGIIDNQNKQFRLTHTLKRDAVTLKNFIEKHVPRGNRIVTDGWSGYDFLDHPNSGYIRSKHIHGGGDFGYGIDSTSHIESIWAQIESKLKETYHSIPSKTFLSFLREIEFKLKNKHLNLEEKIINFCECYQTTLNVSEDFYINTDKEFMNNLNLIFNESDSHSDSNNDSDIDLDSE